MVTVAIIGILMALAVPSFLSYQARSRRTEGMTNVLNLANLEKTYYAERDQYFGTANTWPDFTAQNDGVLNIKKMNWDAASQNAYAELGFLPEGGVRYSYEVNTNCACTNCFTATAFGDVDGNGLVSAVMYVKRGGGSCTALLYPYGPPTDPVDASPIYEATGINRSTDIY
jgi:type II secretory pathway pseudopilin PulG